MPLYTVIKPFTLGQCRYQPGTPADLTCAQAQYLLLSGHLTDPAKAEDAPAQTATEAKRPARRAAEPFDSEIKD